MQSSTHRLYPSGVAAADIAEPPKSPAPERARWEALVRKASDGLSLADLTSTTADDIAIQPLTRQIRQTTSTSEASGRPRSAHRLSPGASPDREGVGT